MKRLHLILVALCLGAATGLWALEPEGKFAVPQGLTLQAKSQGRYLLLWDPIDSRTLMGYSVWLRRKGEKEFVRLSVPVKVGKEVQKQPMVGEAKLELKLGVGRQDLEFSVLAEYEDGPSARSVSVYSGRARQLDAAVAATVTGPVADPYGEVVEAAPSTNDPYAAENATEPAKGPAPWELGGERRHWPLLTPKGVWRTSINVSFEVIRSEYKGRDIFAYLQLIGTSIPYSKEVEWRRVDQRTRFRAPLRAHYGLFEGLELWAEGAYHAEDVNIDVYDVDGQNFSFIRYVHVNPDNTLFYLPDPSSTGFGDTMIGLKAQPLSGQPLVLGFQITLPTGKSRVEADLDWERGRAFGAGTGEGIQRLWGRLDWGWRGLRLGPSWSAAFSPGAAERVTEESGGSTFKHVVTHGDIAELGVAYTFPWRLLKREGAFVPYLTGRSVGATRWTVNGTDAVPFIDKIERSRLAAHAAVKFHREDQLEVGLEAVQDLPGGFETGGRLYYLSGVFGDQMMISGRLAY